MARRAMIISIHGDPLAELGGIQSGGQNIYVRQVALGLQQLDWEVDVFTHWQDNNVEPQVRLGPKGSVIRLAAGRKEFIPKDELYGYVQHFVRELKEYLNWSKKRYDIIHSNYWLSGLAGLNLKEYLGVPQVHTSHSLGSIKASETGLKGIGLLRRLEAERKIVEGVNCVVATAPEEMERLIKDYGACSERIALVPCGVDPMLFHPGKRHESKAQLGLEDKKVVVYVGRFDKNKGLNTLLTSLEMLSRDNSSFIEDVRVLIIGGDPQSRKYLEEEICNRRLDGWVLTVGAQPHEKLPLYYRAAEVCVIPSYYETFGLVALEAMACGTPVIASRVGGLKFTVVDGITGYLVPPRDAQGLAARLGEMLHDPALAIKIGRAAANHVRRQFIWPKVVEHLSALYHEVGEWSHGKKTTLSSS